MMSKIHFSTHTAGTQDVVNLNFSSPNSGTGMRGDSMTATRNKCLENAEMEQSYLHESFLWRSSRLNQNLLRNKIVTIRAIQITQFE